jgi:hypothetical protein
VVDPANVPTGALRFTPERLARRDPGRSGAATTLLHLAIVTYLVDPTILKRQLHPRFEPLRIPTDDGSQRALVSVVTFLDRDFHFVRWPTVRRTFGQTNYRAYVVDRTTGEHVAWFFGTCVDSMTVALPRHVWKLPWHRARMTFDCLYDDAARRYASYRVITESRWAPAELALEDSGRPPAALACFDNLESGLVVLTHPLDGYYFRRDGTLGSYRIWHDRMQVTAGRVARARYPLLAGLDLVPLGDTRHVHSVLIQREIAFTICLPPVVVAE